MEARLLANRIITPDGTMLQSFSQHDCKTYKDANGLEYMVDGGTAYGRYIYQASAPHKDACVYSDDPHEDIRQAFHWGSYGKGGNEPLTWKRLQDMTDAHIEAILRTQHHIGAHIRKVFEDEQAYRIDNQITIEEIDEETTSSAPVYIQLRDDR